MTTSTPAGTAARPPSYEPFGWHHWHDDFWMSYQFRRGLGETQEGGGAVSEVFQIGSRIVANDFESWHREWLHVADRNDRRGDEEIGHGHEFSLMFNRQQHCILTTRHYFCTRESFRSLHQVQVWDVSFQWILSQLQTKNLLARRRIWGRNVDLVGK